MSTLKVNKLRDTAGSADAITLDPNGGAVLAGVTTISTARITTGITTSIQVGGGVTISESGIEASGIGITCANINGAQIGGRRNLIINGDMRIAQRTTSSTTNGYQTVDRWYGYANDIGSITATWSQGTLTSSDTPYSSGFRYYHRVTLSSAGTANAGSQVSTQTRIEAQDISTSGWDYTSSTSFLTASCWVRASTGQTFYLRVTSEDGTKQNIPFAFTVADNTWTKVTWTLPGNSNVQFDNDEGEGLRFYLVPWHGTTYTSSDTANNTWAAYASGTRVPDMASTWLTAGASTFDYTGVQLEVGSQATPFEHRSYGEELLLCQRYFYKLTTRTDANSSLGQGMYYSDTQIRLPVRSPVGQMRTVPTVETTNSTDHFRAYAKGNGITFPTFNSSHQEHKGGIILGATIADNSNSGAAAYVVSNYDASSGVGTVSLNAEL